MRILAGVNNKELIYVASGVSGCIYGVNKFKLIEYKVILLCNLSDYKVIL